MFIPAFWESHLKVGVVFCVEVWITSSSLFSVENFLKKYAPTVFIYKLKPYKFQQLQQVPLIMIKTKKKQKTF